MDLYQLKAFYILARVGSFTETASILFVTQSAVSHAIKKLEKSVDTQLIQRSGKQLELTEAGEALLRSCETIFHEIEKASEELSFHRAKVKQTVRVGAPVEFGTTILITQITDFQLANLDMHLDFYFSHNLADHLLKDKLDFIIDCKNHDLPKVKKIPLFLEQYVCIASPEFVAKNKLKNVKDLCEISVLSCDKQLAWWDNFFKVVPEIEKPQLRSVMQINHIRGMINGAIGGLGVGFVPRYTVLGELDERLLVDPFPQIKPEFDNFNIFIKERKYSLSKNRRLIDYLLEISPSELGG